MTEMKPKHVAQTIRIDILPRFCDIGSSGDSERVKSDPYRAFLDSDDYRFLFQNSYDATLLTREDGRIMVANARAEWMLHCDEDAMRDMSILQIVSGMDDTLLASITKQLESARFMRISAWCARLEGEPFPAEIAVSRLHRLDEVWLCFFIRDESVRRKAEEELRTVHHAIQNAGTGIAVADVEGRLMHTNPALRHMWRIDEATADTLTLADLLGEVIAKTVLQIVKPGATPTWTHEVPVHIASEDSQWVQVSAAVNVDPDNEVKGVVLSFVDVSDRCRAEAIERLRERDRIMAQSLGAVCHHLGQPTTVLLSSIEMMRAAKDRDPELLESLLAMSMDAADEVRQILRKLNDLEAYKPVPYVGSDTSQSTTSIVAIDADPVSPSQTPR